MTSPSFDESREYTITQLRKASEMRQAYGESLRMILPAVEEPWRESAHYKAYVRPTQEEEE